MVRLGVGLGWRVGDGRALRPALALRRGANGGDGAVRHRLAVLDHVGVVLGTASEQVVR